MQYKYLLNKQMWDQEAQGNSLFTKDTQMMNKKVPDVS